MVQNIEIWANALSSDAFCSSNLRDMELPTMPHPEANYNHLAKGAVKIYTDGSFGSQFPQEEDFNPFGAQSASAARGPSSGGSSGGSGGSGGSVSASGGSTKVQPPTTPVADVVEPAKAIQFGAQQSASDNKESTKSTTSTSSTKTGKTGTKKATFPACSFDAVAAGGSQVWIDLLRIAAALAGDRSWTVFVTETYDTIKSHTASQLWTHGAVSKKVVQDKLREAITVYNQLKDSEMSKKGKHT